jgi:hypothetical protein
MTPAERWANGIADNFGQAQECRGCCATNFITQPQRSGLRDQVGTSQLPGVDLFNLPTASVMIERDPGQSAHTIQGDKLKCVYFWAGVFLVASNLKATITT